MYTKQANYGERERSSIVAQFKQFGVFFYFAIHNMLRKNFYMYYMYK